MSSGFAAFQSYLGGPPDSNADAIAREKALKAWKRAWKIELIEQANPHWLDLWEQLNL